MTDEIDWAKSIDDFSEKVSTTIRAYVKDEVALYKIAQVLDEMADQAYHDGYEEGYDEGIDANTETAEEVASDKGYEYGYDEGKYDAQKEFIDVLKDFTKRLTEEFDAGNN
jgi:flagellar biosynthesis/type III secretory pathway protein FliH